MTYSGSSRTKGKCDREVKMNPSLCGYTKYSSVTSFLHLILGAFISSPEPRKMGLFRKIGMMLFSDVDPSGIIFAGEVTAIRRPRRTWR
jgi:hypothetical protein